MLWHCVPINASQWHYISCECVVARWHAPVLTQHSRRLGQQRRCYTCRQAGATAVADCTGVILVHSQGKGVPGHSDMAGCP